MAINSMVVATASVAGPSVAAAILSVASWPWLFALNVPLGALVLAAGHAGAAGQPRRQAAQGSRFSAVDVLLNVLMFALIFVGADRLGVRGDARAGRRAAGAWALLLAGVAVGFVYLRRQRALAVPLFPVDLLRIPVFALSMGTSVGAFCAQMLAFIALPFLLLDTYGRIALRGGPADHGLAAGDRGHGADRGPADRPLSRTACWAASAWRCWPRAWRCSPRCRRIRPTPTSSGAWRCAAWASASSSRPTTTPS